MRMVFNIVGTNYYENTVFVSVGVSVSSASRVCRSRDGLVQRLFYSGAIPKFEIDINKHKLPHKTR